MTETNADFAKRARARLEACKTTTVDEHPGWSINEAATVAITVLPEALDRLEKAEATLWAARNVLREDLEGEDGRSCPFDNPKSTIRYEELCPVCGKDGDGRGGTGCVSPGVMAGSEERP